MASLHWPIESEIHLLPVDIPHKGRAMRIFDLFCFVRMNKPEQTVTLEMIWDAETSLWLGMWLFVHWHAFIYFYLCFIYLLYINAIIYIYIYKERMHPRDLFNMCIHHRLVETDVQTLCWHVFHYALLVLASCPFFVINHCQHWFR